MCDYSLEFYATRVAVEGEILTTARFPSGSLGLIDPKDPTCAVCMSYDTKVLLANLPAELIADLGLSGPNQNATFVHIEEGLHHDGIEFQNGRRVLLHRLGVGVKIEFGHIGSYEKTKELMNAALAAATALGEPEATEPLITEPA